MKNETISEGTTHNMSKNNTKNIDLVMNIHASSNLVKNMRVMVYNYKTPTGSISVETGKNMLTEKN